MNAIDDVVAQAQRAAQAGLRSVWFDQVFQYDAIALAGLVVREVPGLAVGTAAGQALTTQAATYQRKGFRVVGQGRGPLGIAMRKELR